MNKLILGLLLGSAVGLIDIIPMLGMRLPWEANASAFSLWTVNGLLIAASNFKMNGILKGILISFLVLLPNAFIIGGNNPANLIPVAGMTLILGSLLGYLIEKYGK